MTTWADLFADIRQELQDTGATPRYSNQLLCVYAKDAIRDYSQWFPLTEMDIELVVDEDNSLKYPLPAGAIDIVNVQCPLGKFLSPRQIRPGETHASISEPLFFVTDGRAIYLNAAIEEGSEDTVFATYHSVHDVPVYGDIFPAEPVPPEWEAPVLTVSDADLELIKLYTIGKVQVQVRNAQSRLDRFKITAGSREDNPMILEVDDYMKRYDQGIAIRLRGGVIQLFRPQKYIRSKRYA